MDLDTIKGWTFRVNINGASVGSETRVRIKTWRHKLKERKEHSGCGMFSIKFEFYCHFIG